MCLNPTSFLHFLVGILLKEGFLFSIHLLNRFMGFCFTQCLLYIAIIFILCDFYVHFPRFGLWEPLHVLLWPFVMCKKQAKTPLFKVQSTRQELGRWNKNCFCCKCFRDAEGNHLVYLFFISKHEWTTIPALQAQVVPGSSCTFFVSVWTSHVSPRSSSVI